MEGTFWNGYLLFELGPNLLHKAAAYNIYINMKNGIKFSFYC